MVHHTLYGQRLLGDVKRANTHLNEFPFGKKTRPEHETFDNIYWFRSIIYLCIIQLRIISATLWQLVPEMSSCSLGFGIE